MASGLEQMANRDRTAAVALFPLRLGLLDVTGQDFIDGFVPDLHVDAIGGRHCDFEQARKVVILLAASGLDVFPGHVSTGHTRVSGLAGHQLAVLDQSVAGEVLRFRHSDFKGFVRKQLREVDTGALAFMRYASLPEAECIRYVSATKLKGDPT